MSLNVICPYFTMFPLAFPERVLRKYKGRNWVLDPFCGRGTTLFAARTKGIPAIGIDSHPVAVAITAAKSVDVSIKQIIAELKSILEAQNAPETPTSEFWSLLYSENVLRQLCALRSAFLNDCSTPERIALRGLLLGALHGPIQKTKTSYLSNQCQRTYAPKPGYAVKYWNDRHLKPPEVDIVEVINDRAHRYYLDKLPITTSRVIQGDSRLPSTFNAVSDVPISYIITSPPYFGMETYRPDQWLRLWFVGGPDTVDYSATDQLQHASPQIFADGLRSVWLNLCKLNLVDTKLIIRFGGVAYRSGSPLDIIKNSLNNTGWKIVTKRSAGIAPTSKRQSLRTQKDTPHSIEEFDLYCRLS